MGEARRRKAELKERILKECEAAMAPVDDRYRKMLDHVSRLPFRSIHREPNSITLRHGMQYNQCHSNVAAYVDLDTSGRTRMALGWLREAEIYTLHSVVVQNGQHFCITPTYYGNLTPVFAEDPMLRIEGDGIHSWVNWGDAAAPGRLATDHERYARTAEILKQRILDGLDPHKAADVADEIYAAVALA